MSTKTETTTITGLFRDPSKAASAVTALSAKGLHPRDISAAVTEPAAESAFAVETHSKVGDGAAIGAGAGGAIGALVAGFTAVGALAATGVGLVAAGPVVAALAGAGAGAAAGGVLGGLIGLGISENEVKQIEKGLEDGAVFLMVEVGDDQAKDVREAFKDNDVDTLGEL